MSTSDRKGQNKRDEDWPSRLAHARRIGQSSRNPNLTHPPPLSSLAAATTPVLPPHLDPPHPLPLSSLGVIGSGEKERRRPREKHILDQICRSFVGRTGTWWRRPMERGRPWSAQLPFFSLFLPFRVTTTAVVAALVDYCRQALLPLPLPPRLHRPSPASPPVAVEASQDGGRRGERGQDGSRHRRRHDNHRLRRLFSCVRSGGLGIPKTFRFNISTRSDSVSFDWV